MLFHTPLLIRHNSGFFDKRFDVVASYGSSAFLFPSLASSSSSSLLSLALARSLARSPIFLVLGLLLLLLLHSLVMWFSIPIHFLLPISSLSCSCSCSSLSLSLSLYLSRVCFPIECHAWGFFSDFFFFFQVFLAFQVANFLVWGFWRNL